jgi:hypothetical protein
LTDVYDVSDLKLKVLGVVEEVQVKLEADESFGVI